MDPSPNWSTLTAAQFIARASPQLPRPSHEQLHTPYSLIVRFLNAATSDPTIVRSDKEDDTTGFTHAFAVCQFVKDQTPKEDGLKISQEEQETFLLLAEWFRKDALSAVEDMEDRAQKSKKSI
jgi:hypothetical protein